MSVLAKMSRVAAAMPLVLGLQSAAMQVRQQDDTLLLNDPKPTPLPPSQGDIFMHYMPKHNLVVCGCGKCGTSSMYEYLYEKNFGHPWTYLWEPFVQDVESDRWEGTFVHITNQTQQDKIMQSAYSYALIRDPKERLISSWKSKLACGDSFGTDYDAPTFVRNLRALQGKPRDDSITCLSLDDFAETLLDLQKKELLWQVDRHFLPQNHGCFDRFGPERWTKLASIEEEGAFKPIADKLGAKHSDPPHEHSSPSKILVSQRTAEILDTITAEEYKMLKPYLPDRPSKVAAGEYVLETRPALLKSGILTKTQ